MSSIAAAITIRSALVPKVPYDENREAEIAEDVWIPAEPMKINPAAVSTLFRFTAGAASGIGLPSCFRADAYFYVSYQFVYHTAHFGSFEAVGRALDARSVVKDRALTSSYNPGHCRVLPGSVPLCDQVALKWISRIFIARLLGQWGIRFDND